MDYLQLSVVEKKIWKLINIQNGDYMLAILKSLNAHSFSIFQRILLILVSKFMVHRALSDKTYVSLGLLSQLRMPFLGFFLK